MAEDQRSALSELNVSLVAGADGQRERAEEAERMKAAAKLQQVRSHNTFTVELKIYLRQGICCRSNSGPAFPECMPFFCSLSGAVHQFSGIQNGSFKVLHATRSSRLRRDVHERKKHGILAQPRLKKKSGCSIFPDTPCALSHRILPARNTRRKGGHVGWSRRSLRKLNAGKKLWL